VVSDFTLLEKIQEAKADARLLQKRWNSTVLLSRFNIKVQKSSKLGIILRNSKEIFNLDDIKC
jgi:hypothetical protein